MNRNFYKKMKNYKEIKGFIQNEYIRIADILPIWNDIRIAYMNELCLIPSPRRVENIYKYVQIFLYEE